MATTINQRPVPITEDLTPLPGGDFDGGFFTGKIKPGGNRVCYCLGVF